MIVLLKFIQQQDGDRPFLIQEKGDRLTLIKTTQKLGYSVVQFQVF